MPKRAIIPLPVLLGFALSLAIVALAHADTHAVADVPAPPVEQDTASRIKAEDDSSGWLGGFKALFSWRVGDILDAIEVEPATVEDGVDRRDR